ncbi:MAG: sugar ABC transporter permease [Spirochaetales bacterium]|nr:sugar ABC transporter permease [Spirochaetales bacterium]
MDKVLRDKRAIIIFVLPGFLLFVSVVILPMFTSTYYSLFDWDGYGKKIFVGLKNYLEIFTGQESGFSKSIGNAFYLTFLTLIIQFPIALVLALILSSNIKGEGFFRTIYFIPVMLSAVVIAHLFKRIYDPSFGLLNSFLQNIGLESLRHTWLGEIKTAMTSASIPILWQWIGYHMLLLYAGAKSVPNELREAAKIDGAGLVTTSFKIIIPLMFPVIKVCLIMLIVGSIREFDVIYTMTKGGPVNSTQMPSLMMISTMFSRYKYGMGSAMAMTIVILCLSITGFMQRFFKRG